MLREDNDAAIRVMTTGRNPTMKQLHRVHGVSISYLHEIVSKDKKALVILEYCPTDQMKADIYTKAFLSGPKFQQVISRIGVVPLATPFPACIPSDGVPIPVRRNNDTGKGKGMGNGK